ncbi:hypothetical protein BX666DRAFT_1857579 [Dichotomocladium elegans]|nr:hypothetical protein BX666DRAFT_1857579 [Dichotomocladium elegans]
MGSSSLPSFVIISGGSGCNAIAPAFQALTPNVNYVLGISDNGGSTSELIRVLGGPSIGDLRARLTRLIKTSGSSEKQAMKDLLSHRLSATGEAQEVQAEWQCIVEGRHALWQPIPTEKKETVRGFLVLLNSEIIKRAYKSFDFRNASIGNFFLTGARIFFGSLEAAIFLFEAITGIEENTSVLPVIVTNHTAAIAAELQDGNILRGQCEISHPAPSSSHTSRTNSNLNLSDKTSEPANSNLVFEKSTDEKLSSAIRRIYYMAKIYPWPNPKVLSRLDTSDFLVYSIGSLFTSIAPCLILRGIGKSIVQSAHLKAKIMILNGYNDRETEGYTAIDFIEAITQSLNQSRWIEDAIAPFSLPPSKFITHMIYLSNSRIPVDVPRIEKLGIQCIKVDAPTESVTDRPSYTDGMIRPVLEAIINQSVVT